MTKPNIYSSILERIFLLRYKPGMRQIEFARTDITDVANDLKIRLPKNLGDLIYSFRYRTPLPAALQSAAGEGETWLIRPIGRAQYRLDLVTELNLVPRMGLDRHKVLDATPGVVDKFALSDEQALLAKVRYNRLVDLFTGTVCYSLQNHLRTFVKDVGQIETDELYVGVDEDGAHYAIPVQAKGGKDKLNVIQIEQDIALCAARFPALICRPIATQFMKDDVIAMFAFARKNDEVLVASEKHYQLVSPNDLTEEELLLYNRKGRKPYEPS